MRSGLQTGPVVDDEDVMACGRTYPPARGTVPPGARRTYALTLRAVVLAALLAGCGVAAGAPATTLSGTRAPDAPDPRPSDPAPATTVPATTVPATTGPATTGPATTGPGAATSGGIYVDPDSVPAQQARALVAAGAPAEARVLSEQIAGRPLAHWFTGQEADPAASVQALTAAAAAAGGVAVLVVYDLPGRDCGQFSAGGAADEQAYLDDVRAVATGIGDRSALVVLEPDAVAQSVQGCARRTADRTRRLLRSAVDLLAAAPAARVYLDAGNATWVDDLGALAAALTASGVRQAAGFALNVSSFSSTASSAAYGNRLSARLGGAHFVVDTSRNGVGTPGSGGTGPPGHRWCNPAGARLGTPATRQTGLPRVDALLWVKTPGLSDGACTPGAPPAGQWSATLAAQLMGGL